MAVEGKKSSPVLWVVVGCAGAIVLGIIVLSVLAFFGYRAAKRVQSDIKDPAAREARVLEVLGGSKIPEGYHPVLGMSIPIVMDLALLSDRELPVGREPGQGELFGERGFIFVRMVSRESRRKGLEDYIAGRSDDAEALRRAGIGLGRGETLKRGTLDLPGTKAAHYLARRSNVSFGGSSSGRSIVSMIDVECAGSSKLNFGIWFAADQNPEGTPVQSLELTGTPADETALAAFLSSFHLCPAS